MTLISKLPILLLLTVTISTFSMAQEEFAELCTVNTDNSPKAKGISLKLKIPCEWLEFDGDRPAVVKKFGYQVDIKYNTQMMCIVLVNKVDSVPINENPSAEIYSESNLKKMTPPGSVYLSGRMIKVDGLNCSEIIFETDYPSVNGTIYSNTVNYSFFYKNKVINISYGLNSINQLASKNNFNKYLPLFKRMISKTILLNQWQ